MVRVRRRSIAVGVRGTESDDGGTARHCDVDTREDESIVTPFVLQLKTTFPVGLDVDGTAQQAWGTLALPTHIWIDTAGVVRDGALGAVDGDAMAAGLQKILPGVNVTP